MSPPDSGRSCAVCGNPQEAMFKPFCSKRCADIDLGRWLKGNYVIPGGDCTAGERPSIPADLPTDPEVES
ncbi:MAG: DNA gyrase inhibitor YacG [Alphaproteobacteria bacterium]|nr:DNA gyrase inhibitor YacG [Alphaproteobacteria bacterium]